MGCRFQTDNALSNSGNVTIFYVSGAGTKSQVAGQKVGQHLQEGSRSLKLKLRKKTRTNRLRKIRENTTAAEKSMA